MAGTADFNYGELYRIGLARQQTNQPFYLFPFEGGHEWPPLEFMDQAFLWTRLVHFRHGYQDEKQLVFQNWQHIKRESDRLHLQQRKAGTVRILQTHAVFSLRALKTPPGIRFPSAT